jgi:molybdenum cofactor synthesis domain-containing protein
VRAQEPIGEHLDVLADVLAVVLSACRPLPSIETDLVSALGCVLAGDALASLDVPRFDNAAMDGYAICSDEGGGPSRVLTVVGDTRAGQPPGSLERRDGAHRIATGAPVPAGADAVVEQELVIVRPDGTIIVPETVAAGRNIRRRGDDIRSGAVVVPAGTVLRSRHVSGLAAAGLAQVSVHRRPRVAGLTLGDEISTDCQRLGPGEIPNSNRHLLRAAITEADCEAVDGGQVGDDAGQIADAIARLASDHDAVVTTGGVSVGRFDFAARALAQVGRSWSFRLAVKPGKPFAFGVVHGTPVFCLPGNPVAALVAFEIAVRPGLRRLAGKVPDGHLRVRATADGDFRRRPDGKVHFVRAEATSDARGQWVVRPLRTQGSHQAVGASRSNCLVVLDDGEGAQAGESVTAILLPGWEP